MKRMEESIRHSLKGENILILGGSGVLGSRLVQVLVNHYCANVTVLARNLTKAVRIARFPVEIVQGDVTNGELLASAMEGKKLIIDCTFPKEGASKVRRTMAYRMANTIGKTAIEKGVRRLVHLSTISVYGSATSSQLDENNPRRPGTDAYATSKLVGENEMLRLHRDENLPVVILQPTVVYGPFTNWTIGSINQLKNGRIVLPDGGSGVCNAVYIDDVVQAILRAAVKPEIEGEVFLISGDTAITWNEFYGAYEAMFDCKSITFMSDTEVRSELSKRKRQGRPAWRLFQVLRQDASMRQLVLRLPIIAQIYALASGIASKNQMNWFKERLLKTKTQPSAGTNSKPLIFPTISQLNIYESKALVSIEKARQLLDYTPAYNLERGMAVTFEWAKWARLV